MTEAIQQTTTSSGSPPELTPRELREKQIAQAEELLFSGPEKTGFAKDLYFGQFRTESLFPYPKLSDEVQRITDDAVAAVRKYCDESIDAAEIDEQADIPQAVIDGLSELGVLGMTVDFKYGGRAFSQQSYCRIMEVIGSHCAATGVFVNAHHSIGLRGLELFGTEAQKERWMKPMATGKTLAAFALTEPEAGSDAGNVQTQATPTEDGSGFILNGEKRYITNGAIAGVLTVMARTPDENVPEGKVTAFLVTPDMQGFEVVEPRMPKCGIKGTATAKLAFNDMFVPRENVLGDVGKGLRVALTVLDFGRTTFGASCTGAAKFCVEKAIEHASRRRQFGKTLGEFELVQEKIAEAAADTFAMESATYHTAALIDSGAEDYMLETAMLKVFASDALWRIVNDTLQIYGGAGYFSDQPFERMMRDARINLIGEGANDVLRCFIAMYGLRNVGKQLESILKKPWTATKMWIGRPTIPIRNNRLQPAASLLAKQIQQFGKACRSSLIKHRENILDRQFVQARLGDTATELFMASCVFARLSAMSTDETSPDHQQPHAFNTGLCYLKLAAHRNQLRLAALKKNRDDDLTSLAGELLSNA